MATIATEEHADIEPWYKQFWPWFLFSLPATVVVACIVTIILAVRSPLSLVDDNYYKEGLGINEDIAASEYASKLNMEALIKLANNRIQIDLNTEQTAQLQVALIHPTDAKQDVALQMNRIGNRRYESTFKEALTDTNAQYKIRLTGMAGTPGNDAKWVLNDQLPIAFLNGRAESAFNLSSKPETVQETGANK